jgi:hypothetical protein
MGETFASAGEAVVFVTALQGSLHIGQLLWLDAACSSQKRAWKINILTF